MEFRSSLTLVHNVSISPLTSNLYINNCYPYGSSRNGTKTSFKDGGEEDKKSGGRRNSQCFSDHSITVGVRITIATTTQETTQEETKKVKENIVEIPVQEGPSMVAVQLENKATTTTTTPNEHQQKEGQKGGSKAEAVLESQNKRKIEGEEKGKENKGSSKKGRRKKRFSSSEGCEGYQRYLSKVLKQVHPELGVSSKAMTVLNGFINDMFERLANEAAKLSVYAGKTTMSSREIQDAVRLVVPGELGKHAMVEGTKAVSTYMSKVGKTIR
ncbi:hypothetical protein Sjap_013648 [Stephania japonica]|uniref:Core Histone H2A/H2B/H3 domain-containing protein n=1 Tax=Stephania japonica TaxID=461633 RepID=A0AAP0P1I2_9MAGN